MSRRTMLAIAVLGTAITWLAIWARSRRVSDSDRAEQETRSGEEVVDEWGEESFPASDPPASY